MRIPQFLCTCDASILHGLVAAYHDGETLHYVRQEDADTRLWKSAMGSAGDREARRQIQRGTYHTGIGASTGAAVVSGVCMHVVTWQRLFRRDDGCTDTQTEGTPIAGT